MPDGDEIYGKALQLGRAGRLDEAIAWLDQHRGDIVSHAAALGLMGTLLSMNERPKAAISYFKKSIALDATRAAVHSDMGVALTKLNKADAAMACFDRALSLDPAQVQALNNRSHHWLELRQGEPALADADRALALRPRLMPAYRQRSRALLLLNRHEEALLSIEEAITLDPLNGDNHATRGEILDGVGRHSEAVQAFNRAVELQPEHDHGHTYKRGLSHLRHHDFASGWRDYEHRWRDRAFVRTAWRHSGKFLPGRQADLDNLAGKRVLVLDEQGVGDEIMFASMFPDLVATGAEVVCVSNPRLQSLFQASFPEIEVAGDARALDPAAFDRIVPAGNLGARFRNTAEDFPCTPYLRPRREVLERWRERLGSRTTPLRVGVSWRGGVFNTGGSGRSLNLSTLTPLLERSDCEFFSLQYGDVQAEIDAVNAQLSRPVRSFPPEDIEDFTNLAGLVLGLDAVVSVQTALVHLAGAVGAPCVAMIPFFPEWRYGRRGSTMLWYGNVELVRQPRQGDWPSVIDAVLTALDGFRKVASD